MGVGIEEVSGAGVKIGRNRGREERGAVQREMRKGTDGGVRLAKEGQEALTDESLVGLGNDAEGAGVMRAGK